jgi:hypothetical protein
VKESNKDEVEDYITKGYTTPEDVMKISICLYKSGDLEIARDMVKKGSQPDQALSVFFGYWQCYLHDKLPSAEEEERFLLERMNFLLDLGASPHILQEAIGYEVPCSVIKKLIDRGANVNDSKYDALFPSIGDCYDDKRVKQYAEVLIDHGIEMNKVVAYEDLKAPILVHMLASRLIALPELMAANGADLEIPFTHNGEEATVVLSASRFRRINKKMEIVRCVTLEMTANRSFQK